MPDLKENKEQEKFVKINPRTNIINFLPRLVYYIKNLLSFSKQYFFDTSILISKKGDIDGRGEKLKKLNKNLYITAPIKEELDDLLISDDYKKIFDKDFQIVNFEELR